MPDQELHLNRGTGNPPNPWVVHLQSRPLPWFYSPVKLRVWSLLLFLFLVGALWIKTQNLFLPNAGHYLALLSAFMVPLAFFNLRKTAIGHCMGLTVTALTGLGLAAYLINGHRLDGDLEKIISGASILALILLAAGFKMKKFLSPFKVFGTGRAWKHIHIYSGVIALLLLIFHINFRFPVGLFSNAMFYLFGSFIVVGFFGIYLQHVIPMKLADLEIEVVYEKIPQIIAELQERVQGLLKKPDESNVSPLLSSFCKQEVLPFFKGALPNIQYAFSVSSGLIDKLHKFDNCHQFLGEEEQQILDEIKKYYKYKQKLDVHASLQWLLRRWLWLHVFLACLVTVFVTHHLILILMY